MISYEGERAGAPWGRMRVVSTAVAFGLLLSSCSTLNKQDDLKVDENTLGKLVQRPEVKAAQDARIGSGADDAPRLKKPFEDRLRRETVPSVKTTDRRAEEDGEAPPIPDAGGCLCAAFVFARLYRCGVWRNLESSLFHRPRGGIA
ncbi:hypothetical protein [Iodidimonas gelatinilytica]|uniref:hypothetical protein n=1 Tax=Iodidimonas gelatinilytica TaxID=1236966 RepID=UPI001B300063|nr:hypothetical protein [Iodidimonas gelatinilytica]